MEDRMHLTALVESPEHVCCRYRLAAFRPYLEQAGHQLELHSWPRSCWSRLRLGRILDGVDVVILQRRLLSHLPLALLRTASRCLIFDFDDAVFFRDSYHPKGLHSARRLLAFAAMMESVDAVVAGNVFLNKEATAWTHRERVHVIPTCVEPGRYPLAPHTRCGEGVELVWIGSSSTLRGLEQIRPLLQEVGRRCPGVRLKLVSDRFLRLDPLPVEACPWSEAGEGEALAAADIGISWLPDDGWSRGKCGLKVLQYMAAGLPVIANPVGVQPELVRPGETGFLAETPEQWVSAIQQLANDPALRQRLGRAGRQRVGAEFSVSAGAARWLALLGSLGRGRRAA
jgi:glycosyltransferase involved in cell wall biosynthesis